jgi:hypothetical protein
MLNSFPQIMKECFESQDIGKLQEAIRTLPESEARLHMKRCVDSGLWVPSREDEQTNPEDGFVIKKEEEEVLFVIQRVVDGAEQQSL